MSCPFKSLLSGAAATGTAPAPGPAPAAAPLRCPFTGSTASPPLAPLTPSASPSPSAPPPSCPPSAATDPAPGSHAHAAHGPTAEGTLFHAAAGAPGSRAAGPGAGAGAGAGRPLSFSVDGTEPAPAPAAADAPSAPSCPYGFSSSPSTAAADAPSAPSAPSACPYGFSMPPSTAAAAAPAPAAASAPAPAPAVCPYGFSSPSSSSRPLTPLHCSLCRSFLHTCTALQPCTHKFCGLCVSRFQECPVCGADILGREEDLGLQAQVDARLEEMLTTAAAAQGAAGGAGGAGGAAGPTAHSRAAFFLHLGTEALTGGNLQAAYERLEICKQDLMWQQQQQQQQALPPPPSSSEEQPQPQPQPSAPITTAAAACTSSASTSSSTSVQRAAQIGAVLGLQADCCRKGGDLGLAVQLYRDSLDVLQQYAGTDREVAHALTVTLNKLGDMYYTCQDLPAAASSYLTAMEARRTILGTFIQGQALEAAAAAAAAAVGTAGPVLDAGAAVQQVVLLPEERLAVLGPVLQPGDRGYRELLDLAASLIKVGDAVQQQQQPAVQQAGVPQEDAPQAVRSAVQYLCEAQALLHVLRPGGTAAVGTAAPGAEADEKLLLAAKWQSLYRAWEACTRTASP